MTKSTPFGRRLRSLREARGLTVYRLSQLAGVRQTAIANLESGACADPHLSTVQKLAEALSASVADLVG